MDEIQNRSTLVSQLQMVKELLPEGSEVLKGLYNRIEQSIQTGSSVDDLLELIEHFEELAEQMLFTK